MSCSRSARSPRADATSPTAHVTGTVDQPGTVFAPGSDQGSNSAPWQYDLTAFIGTRGLIAFDAVRVVALDDVAIAHDMAVSPIDLSKGAALQSIPLAIVGADGVTPAVSSFFIAGDASLALLTRDPTVPPSLSLVAPRDLGAADYEYVEVDTLQREETTPRLADTYIAPGAALDAVSVTLPARLNGVTWTADSTGNVTATWTTTPPFTSVDIYLSSRTTASNNQQHLSATPLWLDANPGDQLGLMPPPDFDSELAGPDEPEPTTVLHEHHHHDPHDRICTRRRDVLRPPGRWSRNRYERSQRSDRFNRTVPSRV